jgi:hypothetical protein
VIIVVPVFIINCHVSLNPNIGPVIAQTTMTATATKKVTGLPVNRAVHFANLVNHDLDFVGLTFPPPYDSKTKFTVCLSNFKDLNPLN